MLRAKRGGLIYRGDRSVHTSVAAAKRITSSDTPTSREYLLVGEQFSFLELLLYLFSTLSGDTFYTHSVGLTRALKIKNGKIEVIISIRIYVATFFLVMQ